MASRSTAAGCMAAVEARLLVETLKLVSRAELLFSRLNNLLP